MEPAECIVAEPCFERRHGLGKRRRIGVDIDEHQAAPALAAKRKEREVPWVEIRSRPEIAGRCEPAIESVGPAMIAAAKRLFAPARPVLHERPRAMAADRW